ncbi:MAG: aminoglycoside phosphotransferase family protein [Anaerolineaceae bacterium]
MNTPSPFLAPSVPDLPAAYSLLPSALEWLAAVLGIPVGRLRIRALSGATSSTLYGVGGAGSDERWVLRCLTNAEWLAEEPDILERERAALTALAKVDFPAPRWVAEDAAGQICGVPALLMTALPGEVLLPPLPIDAWLFELAKPLVSLHSVPQAGIHWHYHPYVNPSDAAPPAWSAQPALWERAIEIARHPWPDFIPVFIHRDYHPVNVLFSGGRLSGIVDWPNACMGPAGFDTAWCRLNLAFMYGAPAAAAFLRACRQTAGSHFTYHPFWDILALIEVLPGPPEFYPPWAQFGLPPLPGHELIRRVEAYLGEVLRLFDS